MVTRRATCSKGSARSVRDRRGIRARTEPRRLSCVDAAVSSGAPPAASLLRRIQESPISHPIWGMPGPLSTSRLAFARLAEFGDGVCAILIINLAGVGRPGTRPPHGEASGRGQCDGDLHDSPGWLAFERQPGFAGRNNNIAISLSLW